MLQILLAFLAISIISVSGYGLVEQLSLQQTMVDQRENMRRLDVAADAIQGKLVTMPGIAGVYAPAPLNEPSGWSYMPAGLGGVNANVDGTPFLYCPLSPIDGTDGSQVVSPDGSAYGVQVKSGVVVASQLGNSTALAPGISAYRPIAFIIAAGRGHSSPPSCSAVRERNGRPYVDGGLVKIVSMPGQVLGAGTVSAATSDLYVSSSGGGSGRDGDPASIDDALRQWTQFAPAAMTIHLVSDVSVQDTAGWAAFAAALAASSGRLTFDGSRHTLTAPQGQISTSGAMALTSIVLAGPTLVIAQGNQLATSGNVTIAPAAGGSGLYVQAGSRLTVSNGVLAIAGASDNGVESAGDVVMTSASIVAPGKSWSLGLSSGGRLWSSASAIGDPANRNQIAGLAVSGTTSVTSDPGSSVAAAGNGSCWSALTAQDATFSYSSNGSGANSSVTPDPADPGLSDPTNPAQVAAYQAYQREVGGRQRARITNHSAFQCI